MNLPSSCYIDFGTDGSLGRQDRSFEAWIWLYNTVGDFYGRPVFARSCSIGWDGCYWLVHADGSKNVLQFRYLDTGTNPAFVSARRRR